MSRNSLYAGICLAMLVASTVRAADWPQWRGPNFNGFSAVTNLPDKLDPGAAAWTARLPGVGSSTPVVWGDHVFLTASDDATKKLLALCYDLATGKQLWSRDMGLQTLSTDRSDMTSCSAVTDGKLAIFYFSTGELAAFDFDGKEVWRRNIQTDFGPFHIYWIYGSSPLLFENRLFIQVLHNPQPVANRRTPGEKLPADSYILCVNPATGKDLWRQVRPSDAVKESLEAYSTPIPYQTVDRREVLVAGGDFITGHNLETGAETWRIGGYHPERTDNFRLVPSPVLADDLVIICEPRQNSPIYAFRAGQNSPERTTVPVWRTKEAASEVCVPLYYDKKLYIIDGDYKKDVNCLDAATGKLLWNYKTNSRPLIRSSPTGADGKVYFLNEDGDAWVLAAADGKELFHGKLESARGARASVVALAGQVLVRTSNQMYLFKGGSQR